MDMHDKSGKAMNDHSEKLTQMMELTKRSWDERVPIHADDQTGLYDVASFLNGQDTLSPIENAEIGHVSGLKIAHLQCHFGLDTLSLARRGADVTGLDYTPAAVAKAQELAKQAGQSAKFVCADVYDALDHLPAGAFDMVFSTCGVICWLPDLGPWANVVATLLKPGGKLYLYDMHPAMAQLEEENGKLVATYPVGGTGASGALEFSEDESYAGDGRPLENKKTFEWIHSFSHVLASLLSAGLTLEFLREHDTLPWKAVPSMVPAAGRMFKLPDSMIGPSLSFSLMAKRT
ncbi:MAG: class I SAM-dependent methyltransferase [Alphaproteobacteria bacterium]|nr:class I SAM-dependent methyltransferase [Alphaproteobacteria bacterium]